MQALARKLRQEGRKVAFVPTMGYLHDGHLSLVRRAKQVAEIVVVSIFVNPTQFGPTEDFSHYPRDLVRDLDMLKDLQVDYVFTPEADEVYPEKFDTKITLPRLSSTMCGASRPGHFDGVSVIVLKLFNIVLPDFAIFGQKDYQQALIIRTMVRDLNIPVEIIVGPIVRESDGLALSSRNTFLSDAERKAALVLSKSLFHAEKLIMEGERSVEKIKEDMKELFEKEPLVKIDYIDLVDPEDLAPLKRLNSDTLIAVAAHVGKTRLIDNVLVQTGGES